MVGGDCPYPPISVTEPRDLSLRRNILYTFNPIKHLHNYSFLSGIDTYYCIMRLLSYKQSWFFNVIHRQFKINSEFYKT